MTGQSVATFDLGIYVFDEVEVLDFCGPFEVFSVTTRLALRRNPSEPPPFAVHIIGENVGAPIRARGGLMVMPQMAMDQHPPLHILLIPGGLVDREMKKTAVIDWIKRTQQRSQITASVCTGAFLLAQAGLLDGHGATTHWEDQDDLALTFPEVRVTAGRPWIDQGRIITSGGISAGIDMSLHLVERLLGKQAALATARQMEYRWDRG